MHGLFANLLGPAQLLALLILGILIFGRRIPEIGRYLGKRIEEFQRDYDRPKRFKRDFEGLENKWFLPGGLLFGIVLGVSVGLALSAIKRP
jgi:mttA/Hcf106 family